MEDFLDDIVSLVEDTTTSESNVDAKESKTKTQADVKSYNFKKPDKFSKEHIRSLQMIHDSYARINSTSLASLLRTLVDVKVAFMDQFTYEESTRNIDTGSCLAIINMDPLPGNALLEIGKDISFIILDRLLGGNTKEKIENDRTEFTEIELAIIRNIIDKCLIDMRDAWSNVIELKVRLTDIETNSQFAQIASPNDMVMAISLKITVGEVQDKIVFIIPYVSIEPIVSKLSTQYMFMYATRSSKYLENREMIKDHVVKTNSIISVQLSKMNLSVKQIVNFKKGDVIPLNKPITDEVDVLLEGIPKYKGRVGKVKDKISVKITTNIQEEEELSND